MSCTHHVLPSTDTFNGARRAVKVAEVQCIRQDVLGCALRTTDTFNGAAGGWFRLWEFDVVFFFSHRWEPREVEQFNIGELELTLAPLRRARARPRTGRHTRARSSILELKIDFGLRTNPISDQSSRSIKYHAALHRLRLLTWLTISG